MWVLTHNGVLVTQCDNAVRKMSAIYMCVSCYIYIVKVFKISYCKWLLKCSDKATHIFMQCVIFTSLILYFP